jgi:hypothetical protein
MLKLVGVIFALVVVAVPLVADGQQAGKIWRIGILHGMAAQGRDLQVLIARAGENWRATSFVTEMAGAIMKGSAYEPTPWRAVQRATWEAWEALRNGIGECSSKPGRVASP